MDVPSPEDLAKQELRRELRARCGSLTADARLTASRAAVSRLLALPELEGGRTVALYAATRDEADPMGALAVLLDSGARVVFPRVVGPYLEFAAVRDSSDLRPGHHGIGEPPGEVVDPAEIDVVVVPGLGFGGDGMRLGRGGGHYDRTLSRLPASAVRVGFCFDCQVVDHVPRGPHDERVAVIVTDQRVIRAGLVAGARRASPSDVGARRTSPSSG
jgi:5-formyltetrahydrofolate cyclo-ligase